MGYKVDYGALDALLSSFNSKIREWQDSVSSVMEKVSVIQGSQNIAGNSADHMKEYLNTVYSYSGAAFSELMTLFQDNFKKYLVDYCNEVDSSDDTHIEEVELSRRCTDLQGKRSRMQHIALEAENSVRSITDLVSLPSLDISEVDSEFSTILTSIDELDTAVNSLESRHSTSDFTEIDALITQLEAFLQDFIGQRKEFKTDFSMQSFASLESVPALYTAINSADAQLKAQEAEAASASEYLANRIEQRAQKEREKIARRKEQSEWAKIGATIVAGAITAAVTAVSGGVGIVVAGTISGACTSAFSAAADEYVEHGWNFSDYDGTQIATHACIGSVSGAITSGLIPPGMGKYGKAGIKALGSAIETTSTSLYDQYTMSGHITDINGIAEDALTKAGASFVGNLVGSTITDKIKSHLNLDNVTNKLTGSETIAEGLKENIEKISGQVEGHFSNALKLNLSTGLASGMGKRFASAAVTETVGLASSVIFEDKSFEEAYKEHDIIDKSLHSTFDSKSYISDTGSAVTKTVIDDRNLVQKKLKELNDRDRRNDNYAIFGDSPDLHGKENAWDDWNSEEYDRMMNKLTEMDSRGETGSRNYELWGDERGPITDNTFESQRIDAVTNAWEQERRLVMQGRGTVAWTPYQQSELIQTGRVSGYVGTYVLDSPELAGNSDNIRFVPYEESSSVRDGDLMNALLRPVDGPPPGETDRRFIEHRETTSFDLDYKYYEKNMK